MTFGWLAAETPVGTIYDTALAAVPSTISVASANAITFFDIRIHLLPPILCRKNFYNIKHIFFIIPRNSSFFRCIKNERRKKMINLPAYNQSVYNTLRHSMEKRKCALCAATGTGKSYITAKYVIEEGIEQDTLIVVPSLASMETWSRLLPETDLATYQGLTLNRPDLSGYKLVIYDEMHHLGADEWGKTFLELTEHYKGKLLGLTATPVRYLDNNRNIADEFFDGNIVRGVQLSEAIERKILPTFEYITALYDIPKAKKKEQTPYTEKLYHRLDFMQNEYSFQNILRKHLMGKHPIKAIVFVDSLDEIKTVMDSCKEVFPEAIHMDAHSRYSERENSVKCQAGTS